MATSLYEKLAALSLNELRELNESLEREQAEKERAERIKRAAVDRNFFARYYFPHKFYDNTPEFHNEIDRMVDDIFEDNKHSGLILAAPRGSAKTQRLQFLLPLWLLVFKKRRFIVLISNNQTHANERIQEIKMELESNDRLIEDFGDLVGEHYRPAQTWSGSDLMLCWPKYAPDGQQLFDDKGHPLYGYTARVVGVGSGVAVRGMSRPCRPQLVSGDDLELDENVATPEQRRKLMEWWQKAILPMLDPKSGKVVVIGTILHFDSLLSNLLAQDEMYVTKIYKAIQDDGTYLWPERLSPEFLAEQKKKMGGSAFSQEYLNTPLDEDTQVFRPEWFRWYTYPDDVYFDPTKDSWMFKGKEGPQKLRIIQAVDPALDGQDEFCMIVIGVTPQGEVVVLDMFSDHIDFPTQVGMVEQWNAEWVPDILAIEGQAYQGALPQQLQKNGKILTELHVIKRKMNTQAGKAKEVRIKRLSPFISSGQVFLRKSNREEPGYPDPMNVLQIKIHPKTYKLYEQAVQYPSSKNDDRLDAFEIGFSSADVKPWFQEFEFVRGVD